MHPLDSLIRFDCGSRSAALTDARGPLMHITKFTLDRPDSDGAMSSNATVSIQNPTAKDVRWIQYNAVFLNTEGLPLQCSNDNAEDCTIEPGGEFTVSPWGSGIPSQVVGTTRDNVSLTVSAVLHAREFYKLGEVDVPATDFDHVTVERSVTSDTIEGPVRVLLFRQRMDSDGQVRVDCRVALRNKSDLHLARVEIKCELLDADDAMVDCSNDQMALPARSICCIESGIGWLKKSQFRNAKMRLSLYVFKPVHAAQCSGTSSPGAD